MAKPKPKTTTPSVTSRRKKAATSKADVGIARPNARIVSRRRRPSDASLSLTEEAPTSPSSLLTTWLPVLVITAVAHAAVAHGFTTAPEYVRSPALLGALKRAFIVLVCLGSRKQLASFFRPPHKPRTLGLHARAHAKALTVAILANCAGTSVIQPLFGLPPQYAQTVEMVVPVYVGVEVTLGLLGVPEPVLQFVIGFLVSWLKAATISTLVLQWQRDQGAHPVGFVLISTANLFASGFVLRYIAHYHASGGRLVNVSLGVTWSLFQNFFAATAIGIVAHVANHFSTQEERQQEATVLYFLVAWFSLNKYWKASIAQALVYALSSSAPQKTTKTA